MARASRADGSMDDAAQDAAGNIYLPTMPKTIAWNGSMWQTLDMDDYYFMDNWRLFTVTPAGVPWLVNVVSPTHPVPRPTPLRRLTPPASNTDLGYPPTGTHLLSTDDMLWLFTTVGYALSPRPLLNRSPHTLDEKGPSLQLQTDAAGTVVMAGTWPFAPYV
ncbi:MAG: hypothetical protein R2851_20560 [Caldilineaceae bacterium]